MNFCTKCGNDVRGSKFCSKCGTPTDLAVNAYDLDSLSGIASIPIPNYMGVSIENGPYNNIEYILQRKATEHKRNGNMDLAIACLYKSNEIFPHSNFGWTKKDYLRLTEYLRQSGRFDEAKTEEAKIEQIFKPQKIDCISHYFENGSDLVETSGHNGCCCGECAKYTKRIFSEFGYDPRYPKLPDYFKHNLEEHKYCSVSLFPVIHGVNVPAWDYKGDLLEFVNRPFVDERTPEQVLFFNNEVAQRRGEETDRADFNFIRENLPDIAPKSFGGYRRMKNKKSDSFKNIVKEAKLIGYDITD